MLDESQLKSIIDAGKTCEDCVFCVITKRNMGTSLVIVKDWNCRAHHNAHHKMKNLLSCREFQGVRIIEAQKKNNKFSGKVYGTGSLCFKVIDDKFTTEELQEFVESLYLSSKEGQK